MHRVCAETGTNLHSFLRNHSPAARQKCRQRKERCRLPGCCLETGSDGETGKKARKEKKEERERQREELGEIIGKINERFCKNANNWKRVKINNGGKISEKKENVK